MAYKTGPGEKRIATVRKRLTGINRGIAAHKTAISTLARNRVLLMKELRGITMEEYGEVNGLFDVRGAEDLCLGAGLSLRYIDVANAAKDGKIKGHKYKNKWFFENADIAEFILSQEREPR